MAKALTIVPVQEGRKRNSHKYGGDNGFNPQVTARSRFLDDDWDFTIEIKTPRLNIADKVLRWGFGIREAETFTNPKYGRLMLATRQLFYSLLRVSAGRAAMKPVAVIARWSQLKPFLRFIANRPRPILAYDHVTPSVVNSYITAQRRESISASTRYQRFYCIQMLFQHRRKMFSSLKFDPFFPSSPSREARYSASYRQEHRTNYISDKVLQHLINRSLEYVEEWAPRILEASDLVYTLSATAPDHDIFRLDVNRASVLRHQIRRKLAELDSSFPPSKYLPVQPRLRNLNELYNARVQLRAACGVLILFVTGLRHSELLSLKVGCVEVQKKKKEGEFIWIHGTLYKLQSNPEGLPTKWLGGPIAQKAVAILERLTRKTRENSGLPFLMVPVTPMARQRWTNSRPLSELFDARSLSSFVRFIQLRDEQGALYHLHPHLFRRTFARHVVRCDTTNLMALKQHFKHCSIAMTDGYVGIDEELQQILDLENNLLSFDSFDKALRSTHLSGRRGKDLVSMVDKGIADGTLPPNFRGEAGSQFRKNMIREFVAAGQQLYPCGASNFCWFRQDDAECTKGDKPVVEFCNPIGCANSIIERDEHLLYWQAIQRESEKLLALKPEGLSYRSRLVSITRIAEKVISDLT